MYGSMVLSHGSQPQQTNHAFQSHLLAPGYLDSEDLDL